MLPDWRLLAYQSFETIILFSAPLFTFAVRASAEAGGRATFAGIANRPQSAGQLAKCPSRRLYKPHSLALHPRPTQTDGRTAMGPFSSFLPSLHPSFLIWETLSPCSSLSFTLSIEFLPLPLPAKRRQSADSNLSPLVRSGGLHAMRGPNPRCLTITSVTVAWCMRMNTGKRIRATSQSIRPPERESVVRPLELAKSGARLARAAAAAGHSSCTDRTKSDRQDGQASASLSLSLSEISRPLFPPSSGRGREEKEEEEE